MRFTVGDVMAVEGSVTMTGDSGAGKGGGAGGTIWLDTAHLEGWGILEAGGGNVTDASCGRYCTCLGGGGGGGRIRTYTPGHANKLLMLHRSAAAGTATHSSRYGASGTLFISSGSECSGNGIWDPVTRDCTCHPGFSGEFCQYRCDSAVTCGGQGACSDDGSCECDSGYVGYECEHECDADADCSAHGRCTVCGNCHCDACYHGNDCSELCSGSGNCVASKCVCDSCHLGEFCESECNDHGACVTRSGGSLNCSCEEGWRGSQCTIAGCPGTDEDCSGHGLCNAAEHTCVCDPGWQGKSRKHYQSE